MPYVGNSVIRAGPPVSPDELSTLERSIDRIIPHQLKLHMEEYDGGRLEKWHFQSSECDNYDFHQFLSVRPSGNSPFEFSFNIAHVDPGFMPPDLIPFAVDPGGAFFCLDKGERVVFFDAENLDDAELMMCIISDSLKRFIEDMR